MGRVCIISYCNLYVLPYVNDYIAAIRKNNDCVLLFWNRGKESTSPDLYKGCVIKEFKKEVNSKTSRLKKLIYYVKCNRFIKRDLSRECYDGLIFLQTQGAVFCHSVLKKKYKFKYIVDIIFQHNTSHKRIVFFTDITIIIKII